MDRIVSDMTNQLAAQRQAKIKEQLQKKGIDENVPLRGIQFSYGQGTSYYFDELFILWVSDPRVEVDQDNPGRIGCKVDFSLIPPCGKDVFGVDKARFDGSQPYDPQEELD